MGAIGAIVGGGAAALGSIGLDAVTGGANILATPAEVGEGAFIGGVIGHEIGRRLDSLSNQQSDDASNAGQPANSEDNKESRDRPPPLPANPDDLLGQGYVETSHPDAAANGHRTFENPKTGDKIRFDAGRNGEPGYEGKDHYHRFNPNSTGKRDQYLDKKGSSASRGGDQSHLLPGE